MKRYASFPLVNWSRSLRRLWRLGREGAKWELHSLASSPRFLGPSRWLGCTPCMLLFVEVTRPAPLDVNVEVCRIVRRTRPRAGVSFIIRSHWLVSLTTRRICLPDSATLWPIPLPPPPPPVATPPFIFLCKLCPETAAWFSWPVRGRPVRSKRAVSCYPAGWTTRASLGF